MKRTADCALRALDAHLSDGKWSTYVVPPAGSRAGESFHWNDAAAGINSTAVTVPADWLEGPVLVRLHRTPVAPRLPPPSASPPPLRPLRPIFSGQQQLAGIAETRPVNFSDEWKDVFKVAGIKRSDLSDPIKAAKSRINNPQDGSSTAYFRAQ